MNSALNLRLRYTPVTLVLIALSVIVTLLSLFGSKWQVIHPLMFSGQRTGMREILSGQVWRLVTPIFVHFGPLHILFNMLWLFDLGSGIEYRQRSARLAWLVGLIGITSNLAQYLWSGPNFGGMSGVVYGLLGYVWVLGKLNPRSGLILHPHIVVMMLVWFVICWSGLVGPIANMAHTAGLVGGMFLGWLFSRGFYRGRWQ